MVKKILEKYGFIFTSIVLFTVLRLPSLFEPYWYGDEGIYLVLGQAIRKGLTLYTQIHDNKPPSLYYLAAFSQTVFGFRLLLALSMVVAVYYFNLLSKKFLSKKLSQLATIFFIILTSIPLIEGNIANAEVFMLLPTLAGFYYLLYSKSELKYVISGLLLGVAFTIKIPVAVEFGMLFLWIFLFTKEKFLFKIRQLIIFTAAFFTPFILYLVYFTLNRAFSDFMFSAILQNFGYLSSWQTGSHSGSATSGGLLTRAFILLLFWVFTYVLIIKKILTRELGLIIFWFSATVFGALLSTRPYPHYLIQIVPSLSLLVFYFFDHSLSTKIRFFLISLLICLGLLIYKYQFYAFPVASYYQNFYSHVFSLNSSNYRRFFGSQVDDTYRIAAYVKENTVPEEKIFVWGDEPYIYALSDRLPVGRFTVAYHISDFNQYKNTYDQLTINFPKLIIYFPQDNRYYPSLEKMIHRYYLPVETIGRAIIYQRNN